MDSLRDGVQTTMTATSQRFEAVSVSETRHAPGSVLPPHEHTTAYLSFVVRGDYSERVGRHTIQCPTYRLRFHPRGEVHADAFGAAGGTCLNIELGDRWTDSLEECRLTDPNDLVLDDSAAWLALRVRHELRLGDPDSMLAIEGLTAHLLDGCARSLRESCAIRSHPSMARAVEFIRANIAAPFRLGDVAEAADLHRTHFARAFRTQMGCTVGAYVRRARSTWAQDQMRKRPRQSLSRLAVDAGFADHAHFTRTFSRVVGVTPSAFRRAIAIDSGDSPTPR